MGKKYGIIVIGYNRLNSLKRLLNAIHSADYKSENITLIISLDNSGDKRLEDCANSYVWEYGKKVVKTFPQRLGLRKHVLTCGSYLEEFDLDAAAVFEDDVLPSRAFFNFVRQAVEYYGDKEEIAGISLYTHLWNLNAEKPFQPLYSKNDTYFIQSAQSWGQVWLRKQWKDFSNWYEINSKEFREIENVPNVVSNWPNTSWLKYHIRYCIETNRYFVYPYESLATNFTDIGEHNSKNTTLFQVPLQLDSGKEYVFSDLNSSEVIYDAYFENQKIADAIGVRVEELCVDLYGTKDNKSGKRYWLTKRICNFSCIKTYACLLKPHELNVLMNISGSDIFLYDTTKEEKNNAEFDMWREQDYFFRLSRIPFRVFIKVLMIKIWRKIKNRNA